MQCMRGCRLDLEVRVASASRRVKRRNVTSPIAAGRVVSMLKWLLVPTYVHMHPTATLRSPD